MYFRFSKIGDRERLLALGDVDERETLAVILAKARRAEKEDAR